MGGFGVKLRKYSPNPCLEVVTMEMEGWTLIALIAVVVLIGAALTWVVLEGQRRKRLRARFGSEYDNTVRRSGGRLRAESELEAREKRVKEYEIRPLAPETRARFAEEWRLIQGRFVDRPSLAVAEADTLVTEVMHTRGYPMSNFEQRAADISVDHPHVVEHYRAARTIAVRSERGNATTEELRQAMVHYRTLFEDLLETPVTPHAET